MIDKADLDKIRGAMPALRKCAEAAPTSIIDALDSIERMVNHLTPIPPKNNYPKSVQCPICKKMLRTGILGSGKAQAKFCDKCGQAIDWNAFNEKYDRYFDQHPNPDWDYKNNCPKRGK